MARTKASRPLPPGRRGGQADEVPDALLRISEHLTRYGIGILTQLIASALSVVLELTIGVWLLVKGMCKPAASTLGNDDAHRGQRTPGIAHAGGLPGSGFASLRCRMRPSGTRS